MSFTGTSSNIGGQRVGAAHTARELVSQALGAGTTTILGPLRTIGMQRIQFVLFQSSAAPVATANLQYRVGLTWHDLAVNIPAVVGQPVVVSAIAPGARQVRAVITAPGAGPVTLTATLGALQGS